VYTPLSSTVVVLHYSAPHTLWGCAVKLAKPVPDMTYNVFGGILNLALSIYVEPALAPTVATIVADAAVTPPSPK